MPCFSAPTNRSPSSRFCHLLIIAGQQGPWLATRLLLLQRSAQLLSLPWELSWRRQARWSGTDSCRCMFLTSLYTQVFQIFGSLYFGRTCLPRDCFLQVEMGRRGHCLDRFLTRKDQHTHSRMSSERETRFFTTCWLIWKQRWTVSPFQQFINLEKTFLLRYGFWYCILWRESLCYATSFEERRGKTSCLLRWDFRLIHSLRWKIVQPYLCAMVTLLPQ